MAGADSVLIPSLESALFRALNLGFMRGYETSLVSNRLLMNAMGRHPTAREPGTVSTLGGD